MEDAAMADGQGHSGPQVMITAAGRRAMRVDYGALTRADDFCLAKGHFDTYHIHARQSAPLDRLVAPSAAWRHARVFSAPAVTRHISGVRCRRDFAHADES